MIRRIKKILGLYKISEQLHILPYRSYGTKNHLYVKGRVLDNEPLRIEQDQSFFKTLNNTYKQFDSFEVPHAEVELLIPPDLKLHAKANEEGYFVFDTHLQENLSAMADEEGWLDFLVFYKDKDSSAVKLSEKSFVGDLLVPEEDSEYGIISDIDDTILQTGVTSFLKLRLLKNSLLTNAYRRIPLKGAADLYQKLHSGLSGKNKNPVFYLSNSPWNLYEYLKLFLDHNHFPKGPILLRNFRTPFDRTLKPEKPHKQKEIINILKSYPDLKFILVGDSGEHDASIYTDIAAQFPDRILAIYLRSVKHKRRMNRVRSIIDNFTTTPVLLVESSEQAEKHARENGFIK